MDTLDDIMKKGGIKNGKLYFLMGEGKIERSIFNPDYIKRQQRRKECPMCAFGIPRKKRVICNETMYMYD